LGSILVQVVRATIGPTGHLVATCSKPNIPFVTSLGADEVIDYTAHSSLSSHLSKIYFDRPFDAILDTVYTSPSLYTSSPSYLKSSGLYLNAGGMGMPHRIGPFILFFFSLLLNYIYPSFLPGGVNRRFAFLSGNANEKDHREVKRLVESGQLRVELDSVWGMGEALRAYERIESRRARGKVVVKVG
jgi:NADPH:quinone reductase-like Zn-dependent oxidoreductase